MARAECPSSPSRRDIESATLGFAAGAAVGAAVDWLGQHALRPCGGRPFGLYGELESESQTMF
ncbi:MAG: hypothetical protein WA005_07050, partial [Candidatus Binataceae bacterium]